MSSSRFIFEGFLPKKKIERDKILLEISKSDKTIIIYESPHRLVKLLKELKEFCGSEREIQVFKELTKKFEEHIGDRIDTIIERLRKKEILGEVTIVIKGISRSKNVEGDTVFLKKELHELINAGLSLSAASKYLAKKTKLPKSEIYKLH